MSELISFLHRTAPPPAFSHNDFPIDTISAEIIEEFQAEWTLKLKLAMERAKHCEMLTAKAVKLVAPLQKKFLEEPGQRSTREPAVHEDTFATLLAEWRENSLAEWRENSQLSAFASRDLVDAIGQVMKHAGAGRSVNASRESHREFFDRLAESMRDLDENWLANYEDALAKYIDFFTEFNDIMAQLQQYITASDDGQKVTIEFLEIREKLTNLLSKYQATGQGLSSFPSRAEAQKFIDDLGLSGLTIRPSANGDFEVMIDLSPLSSLIDSIPIMIMPGVGIGVPPATWDMARYNAWLSGKDSYTEQLQHVSKVLGEKYSRNLQLLDTLIKVLSSSIDSIGEADRTFVNNF